MSLPLDASPGAAPPREAEMEPARAASPESPDEPTPTPTPSADDAAAVLAHELRGPLAVVAGYLDLLGRTQDEGAREYALGAAARAVARMDALIDDVLETVCGSHPGSRRLEPVDPTAVVRELIAERPAYRERVVVSSTCSVLARADELHLARVVSNVLDNALKFSPPNATVRVTLADGDGGIRVIVEDEGPGFPSRETRRLRRRFQRLDRDASIPGYGIGLGVTVELVEAMGGEVALGNRSDGPGARVEITLPQSPPVTSA